MGSDKAKLEFGGRSLLAVLASRLGDLFDAVRVVGGSEEVRAEDAGLSASAFRWIPDRWPGGGPLGGLCSGLAAVETQEAFAAACDMPLLDPDVVRALRPGGGWRADVRVLVAGGRSHPLHAFYRVACLPRLERAFVGGVRSLHEALAGLAVEDVELSGALAARAERSAWNVNTPDDVERVRRFLTEAGTGEA